MQEDERGQGVGQQERREQGSEGVEGTVLWHEECSWTVSPPPHRLLKLTVNTEQIRNGENKPKSNNNQ